MDKVFKNLGVILLFINTVLYTYSYFKDKKNITLKYFAIYLTLTFCVLFGSIVILDLQKAFNLKPNNLFLSHFYFIFQFIFLTLFYRELFNNNQKNYQKVISVVVVLILLIQYIIKPNLFFEFNLLEIFITSFPLIIYSIIHLYNALGKQGKYMCVNAAILIYLSVSTLIFILGNVINFIDRSLSLEIWLLNKVFYVGYLILILIEWKKSLWRTKN